MKTNAPGERVLVVCLTRMVMVCIEQRKDPAAAVVEAGAAGSNGGDAEPTAKTSLLAKRGLVKRQGVTR